MSKITITEALAEIPTIEKRVAKKQAFIQNYLYRQASIRDPHEKDGGSAELIAREMQAIDDLHRRIIKIRAAIQAANYAVKLGIGDAEMTIGEWLTWRREVASQKQIFLAAISNRLNEMRQMAVKKGVSVTDKDPGFTQDFVVNVNEKMLADRIEELEMTLGVLDGRLSLANATITIDV